MKNNTVFNKINFNESVVVNILFFTFSSQNCENTNFYCLRYVALCYGMPSKAITLILHHFGIYSSLYSLETSYTLELSYSSLYSVELAAVWSYPVVWYGSQLTFFSLYVPSFYFPSFI